jgi:DNA polymerase-1
MRCVIIDSNALLHRAFHALPRLSTKDGKPTGGVYGFLLALFRAVKDLNPEYLIATFDTKAPTFRHKKFKEYKAKRKKPPEEFYQQIPILKEVLLSMNIPIFEKEGFEADDVIASLVKKIPQNIEVIILSGDLDTLQLVKENVKVYTFKKGIKEGKVYDRNEVIKRFGVPPENLVDFKALCGDVSDNIPGVPGIGEKTASLLIQNFKTIENLYQNLDKIKNLPENIVQTLREHQEEAFFSKLLAKARDDLDLKFTLEDCQFGKFDLNKAVDLFKKLEFFSLIKRLKEFAIKEKNLF